MQFTLKNTSALERRLEVEVPHARVAGEVERRLRQLSLTANIRGFRKGKVPLPVIKQQFGAQVHSDAVGELIRQGYSDAVTKEKLRPASGPRIEPIQVDAGTDLKFAAVFEVLPEIQIKDVASIAIERPKAEIADSDIDAMLESMRKQKVDYAAVERAAQKDDRVVVDFLGKLDDVAFSGGEGKDTKFIIGSGRALPDFENALIGMKVGETKIAPVAFPEGYAAKELAGKTTSFDLTVKAVEEPVLPPVDDAFAVSFGITEGGLPKLREEVQKSMEREAAEAIRGKLRSQVFDALQKDNPLDLPRSLVDEQIQQMQIDLMQRMGRTDASQVPPREPFEEPARRRVHLGLLVGELVQREKLQIDRERVFARLEEVCSGYPNPEQVRQQYLQTPDAMRQIETAVIEDQAVDWVLAHAAVTERTVPFAELTGFKRPA